MSGTPVLARILCDEILNIEIELASNEEKRIVAQLVVVDVAGLVLSLEISDEIRAIEPCQQCAELG